MALIKHAAAGALPRDAIVLNLAELSAQAAEITRQAQARAAAIVAEAQAERRRLLDTATAEGFAAGEKAGREKGLAEGREQGLTEARAAHTERLSALEARWAAALDRFDAAREPMLMHARADVLALALRMGERVTKRVVEVDSRVAAAQVRAVLEMIARPSRLTLRVHPDDLAEATREAAGLASRLASARHAEVVADDAVTRGSVVASSDRGTIDASIETQLERIVAALLPGGVAPRDAGLAAQAPDAAAPVDSGAAEAPSADGAPQRDATPSETEPAGPLDGAQS